MKTQWKKILIVLGIIGVIMFYMRTEAATLFDPAEDFNALGDGSLSGTSSWTGSANWKVQSSIKREGAKAIMNVNGAEGEAIEKIGTEQTDGTMVMYVYTDTVAGSYLQIFLEDTAGADVAQMMIENAKVYGYHAGYTEMYANLSADTWYAFKFFWRTSDDAVSYALYDANGTWVASTSWAAGYGVDDPKQIDIQPWSTSGTQTYYIDCIGEDFYSTSTPETAATGSVSINKGNIRINKGSLKID